MPQLNRSSHLESLKQDYELPEIAFSESIDDADLVAEATDTEESATEDSDTAFDLVSFTNGFLKRYLPEISTWWWHVRNLSHAYRTR